MDDYEQVAVLLRVALSLVIAMLFSRLFKKICTAEFIKSNPKNQDDLIVTFAKSEEQNLSEEQTLLSHNTTTRNFETKIEANAQMRTDSTTSNNETWQVMMNAATAARKRRGHIGLNTEHNATHVTSTDNGSVQNVENIVGNAGNIHKNMEKGEENAENNEEKTESEAESHEITVENSKTGCYENISPESNSFSLLLNAGQSALNRRKKIRSERKQIGSKASTNSTEVAQDLSATTDMLLSEDNQVETTTETDQNTNEDTQLTLPNAPMHSWDITPVRDATYVELFRLTERALTSQVDQRLSIASQLPSRQSMYSMDTMCTNDNFEQWKFAAEDPVPLYSVSSTGPLLSRRASAFSVKTYDTVHFRSESIVNRPSLLSFHNTATTLSEYVRRHSLEAVDPPTDALVSTERISPLGGVASVGGCILRVPHGSANEEEVKLTCWFTKEVNRGDEMIVSPTLLVERGTDVTDKPSRVFLPTCYSTVGADARIAIEWSSHGTRWRHLTEVSNPNSRFVEFKTIMNCRFRATIPREHQLSFQKLITSVAFAKKVHTDSSSTVITWCLCDANSFSEARVWLHMAPRGVHERVVEARSFAIRKTDTLTIRLSNGLPEINFSSNPQELVCSDLWPSLTFKKLVFHVEGDLDYARYYVYRNSDVIIDGDVWLTDSDEYDETCSLLERGVASKDEHAHKATNRSRVRRSKTTAGDGIRRFVKRVKKRKNTFF